MSKNNNNKGIGMFMFLILMVFLLYSFNDLFKNTTPSREKEVIESLKHLNTGNNIQPMAKVPKVALPAPMSDTNVTAFRKDDTSEYLESSNPLLPIAEKTELSDIMIENPTNGVYERLMPVTQCSQRNPNLTLRADPLIPDTRDQMMCWGISTITACNDETRKY
jgi:hypothetical protein